MKFESKTALWEHIISLKDAGYLIEKQLVETQPNGRTIVRKVYAINFDNITVKT